MHTKSTQAPRNQRWLGILDFCIGRPHTRAPRQSSAPTQAPPFASDIVHSHYCRSEHRGRMRHRHNVQRRPPVHTRGPSSNPARFDTIVIFFTYAIWSADLLSGHSSSMTQPATQSPVTISQTSVAGQSSSKTQLSNRVQAPVFWSHDQKSLGQSLTFRSLGKSINHHRRTDRFRRPVHHCTQQRSRLKRHCIEWARHNQNH